MSDKKFDWDALFNMEGVELVDPADMTYDERQEYIEICCREYLQHKKDKLTKLEVEYGKILSRLVKTYGH